MIEPETLPAAMTEESYRLMVESVRDYGIFMLDPVGRIRSWNLGAQRLKGYRAEDVIGQHFSIFYTEEDRARRHPENELEIAKREGRYEEEGWRVRKDGTRFWANIILTRLTGANGELIGFGKVTRDLTERKRAEDALRASEEESRLVFASVKDYALIALDPKGIVTRWNEGARRIKGYEAEEILGKHFSVFYEKEAVRSGMCEYELEQAAYTGRFEDEGWRVRKDGTRFWANVVLTPLFDKHGNLHGYFKVTRDVTERKQAEDRLRMSNEGLERRVRERTEELETANARLQEAIRSRDEFMSIASHELRTPVTPLKIQIQALAMHLRRGNLAELSAERLQKMAATIERSIGRLGNLVDSLLDVARINAGKVKLNPEEFAVDELIHEIVLRFRPEAKLVGSEILAEGTGPLVGNFDRLRVEQVITNLVVNAIKYGNGGTITVFAGLHGGNLRIRVRDRGIGIPPDDLPRIFNRFEQVRQSDAARGLGLGLYITKQIVDAHGGTIEVESEVGRGTVFTIDLPRAIGTA